MTTTTAKTELIQTVFNRICIESYERLLPWFENGIVYITDGRIAVTFDCDEPPEGIMCRVYDSQMRDWRCRDTGFVRPSPPRNFDQQISYACRFQEYVAFPEIVKPEDSDERWQIEQACDICDGKQWVTCNMGHEHDCEECEDGIETVYCDEGGAPVEVGEAKFQTRLLWHASQLPNVRLCTPKPSQGLQSEATGFVFDGGRGVIMPML